MADTGLPWAPLNLSIGAGCTHHLAEVDHPEMPARLAPETKHLNWRN